MKNFVRIILIAGFTVISAMFLTPIYSKQNPSDIERQMRMFSDIFVLVNENYVEEVDTEELMRGAFRGMTDTLDPYSSYLEPDTAELCVVSRCARSP